METRYATYALRYARDVSGLCVSPSEYVCLRQRGKTVKMPYESPILFVRNPNGIVRLLSEPHTETQTTAYVCSKIYIREKINLHTTEKLFPYVRSQILIKDEVDIYLCDHKNRKINHYINRIKNMSQCEEPQKNSSLITLSPLVFMITDRMEQSEQNEKKKLNTPKDNIFPKRMEVKNNLNKVSSRLCC